MKIWVLSASYNGCTIEREYLFRYGESERDQRCRHEKWLADNYPGWKRSVKLVNMPE